MMSQEEKKHSAVDKLNNALPHYFLKICLGVLIIFLVVQKLLNAE